jgi:hypothetical protein
MFARITAFAYGNYAWNVGGGGHCTGTASISHQAREAEEAGGRL